MLAFIVTHYGCNSSPSAMWTPRTRLFMDYTEAYEYFISVAPSIDNTDRYYDEAVQYINGKYDSSETSAEYIVIEDRCQMGADDGGAKRPFGAVIARCGL